MHKNAFCYIQKFTFKQSKHLTTTIIIMNALETVERLKQRFPNEPEYIQAVSQVLGTIEEEYNRHPEFEQANLIDRLCIPDRIITFRVTWVDDKGRVQVNMGYRVQHNNAIGPYKGGIRFHASVTPSVLKFLAFEQTFKKMNSQLNKLDYTKHSNSNWIEKRKNDIGLTDSFLMDSSNNEIGEIMSSFDTHGFAVIKGDKGYGLIDKQLKVVLDCSYIFKYNRCGPDFAYHYLVVQKNGCYGLVNEIGKIVVPCQYPGFASFSNADNNNLLDRGFLCITDGNKYGLIEIANSNQYLLNCVYDRIVFHSNKQYIWQDFLYAADNRYIVGYSAKSCTVFDVLSRQFFTMNEQVYNIEVIFNNHVVAISKFSKTDDTLKYNILSIENGITMNEKEYDGLATLDGKYIQVRQGENWGIFDLSENKEIIPCQYFHGEKQS